MDNKNYDHLVGKRVYCEKTGVFLFVAAIDQEVGITMHFADDRDKIARCIVHPDILAKRLNVDRSQIANTDFNALFAHYVNGIECGTFTESWHLQIDKDREYDFGRFRAEDFCAFR